MFPIVWKYCEAAFESPNISENCGSTFDTRVEILSKKDWFAWPTIAPFISFCVADTDKSLAKSPTAEAPFAAAPPAPATFSLNLSL